MPEKMVFNVQDFTDSFENFLTVTETSRVLAARDRDYVDHKQWTEEQISKLRARGQSPIVINRLKAKVNFLVGAERSGRNDPKALPRTPDHEDAADAVTDALRFVADNADFDQTASQGFEDMVVWSTEAAIVEVEQNAKDEYEVQIREIAGDRFYYDPHSRKRDFSDAKFMGINIWMDEEDAIADFPDKEDEIKSAIAEASGAVDGTTFDDQPRWMDRKRKRLRVCQHYFKHKGIWNVCYFSDNLFLIDPKPSPYVDEDGEPENPIEAQSAYIDRENNRYGEVRAFIDAQDEINHRRSKALYAISVRQTIGNKGAVEDINAAKAELAKANGHVELTSPQARFELLDTNDITATQLQLYQDAKGELDNVGPSAELGGDASSAGLSGRAIQALQQGGLNELGSLFDGHRHWKRRIYRQIWNRIKQFWDAEKWVRVTDDESNLQWVGLNQPVTYGQMLMERAEQGDEMAAQMLQQMINDPRLNEVAEVRNNVAEMDVDITVSETRDYANIRQEQFETLSQLAQSYGPQAVPFEAMLKLSDMSNKDEVEELLKGDQDPEQAQAAAELQSEMAESKLNNEKADTAAKTAKAAKDHADAEAQQIENQVVANQLGLVGQA